MRKILRMTITFFSFSLITSSVIACSNQWHILRGDVNLIPPKPIAVIKDMSYYQKLKKETQVLIKEFEGEIKEIKTDKNNKEVFPTIADYNQEIERLESEKALIQARFYNAEYQILILENKERLNKETKEKVINNLKKEIEALEKAFVTHNKYQNEYDQQEVNEIAEAINNSKLLQKKLNKEDNLSSFKGE